MGHHCTTKNKASKATQQTLLPIASSNLQAKSSLQGKPTSAHSHPLLKLQRQIGNQAVAQMLQATLGLQHKSTSVVQRPNNTGLPEHLKSGIESLSGLSMDHVKVHYNSPQPVQLNALAYAQGSDIHLASGQEQHLPHEAWHVVQQMQGRVQPTIQMKDGVPVNDAPDLEYEADVMGVKALQDHPVAQGLKPMQKPTSKMIQLYPERIHEDIPLYVDTEIPGLILIKHPELGSQAYRIIDGGNEGMILYWDEGKYYTDRDCSEQANINPYVRGTENANGASYSYHPNKLTGQVMDISEVVSRATNLRKDINPSSNARVDTIIRDEATGHPTRPIEVRLESDGLRFRIIQGNHRIFASQLLNKTKIPVNFI
jgi:hypothetical protein